VLERVGTELASDRTPIDEQLWIPLSAAFARGPRRGSDVEVVDVVLFRVASRADYGRAVAEVRAALAERLGVSPDDHEAIRFASAVELLAKIPLRETTGFLVILSVTTLAVSALGAMNMMLVSVQERRGEIGTRLALGATRADLVLQFAAETLAVIGTGGLVGVALGTLGCVALAALDLPDLVPVPELSPRVFAVALASLAGVALAASVLPAWRAADTDPAAILRSP
jgi:ABC-type antimicrobial peptide transport system permease subunit